MKLEKKKIQDVIEKLTKYIQEKMNEIGATKAVLGISGGKDSSTVAALLCRAIGKENVYGLLMPDGEQSDIAYAKELVEELGIHAEELNIEHISKAYYTLFNSSKIIDSISSQTKLNLPPRIRMALLYGYAQSLDRALVVNTSNLSEDWVGYATIYGDATGAFSPLAYLTTDEVVQIAKELGLSDFLASKVPSDGLTGKTDEEVLGFSYEVLNRYLRTCEIEDEKIKERIDYLHRISRFKFLPIDMCPIDLPIIPEDLANIYGGNDDTSE